MFTRISYFYIKTDIYSMKDSVYIESKEKDYDATVTYHKPAFIAIAVSVVLIILLNLANTLFFSR